MLVKLAQEVDRLTVIRIRITNEKKKTPCCGKIELELENPKYLKNI